MKSITAVAMLLVCTNTFAFSNGVHSDQKLEELGMHSVFELGSKDSLSPRLFATKDAPERQLDVEPLDYLDTAKVFVIVDKAAKGTSDTAQTLSLYLDGEKLYSFPVSTGKETEVKSSSGRKYKATTPIGFFRPTKIYKEYFSYTWGGAPMPHAVFFDGGTALHATTSNHFNEIGQRDSGGCVRMMPKDAKIVNETILSAGLPIWRIAEEPVEIKIKKWIFTIKKFTVVRTLVTGNTEDLPKVDRFSGDLLEASTPTVDAIIAITDRSK